MTFTSCSQDAGLSVQTDAKAFTRSLHVPGAELHPALAMSVSYCLYFFPSFLKQNNIVIRDAQVRVPCGCQPEKGLAGEKADVREIILIIPAGECGRFCREFCRNAQPASALQAGPQPIELPSRFVQMLHHLGGGYEVVLSVQRCRSMLVILVEDHHGMPGLFEHPGKRWLGTRTEIQTVASWGQTLLKGNEKAA